VPSDGFNLSASPANHILSWPESVLEERPILPRLTAKPVRVGFSKRWFKFVRTEMDIVRNMGFAAEVGELRTILIQLSRLL